MMLVRGREEGGEEKTTSAYLSEKEGRKGSRNIYYTIDCINLNLYLGPVFPC